MFRTNFLNYIKNYHLFENNILKNVIHSSSVKTAHVTFTSKATQKRESLVQNRSSSSYNEQEFLVKLKTNPDSFGNPEDEILTEEDIKEEKYFTEQPLASQKLSTKKYADIIKGLIGKRKIKEAIDVVEVRMLKEDKVKPENYIYNLLLGACGRVGYTKKAFMLYNDMKRRGLKITAGSYTALFNACANSPWPLSDGLDRANKLRDIMVEKGYEPNDSNYNAMIKAFGRCGDQTTAFSLVDEMISKGIPIKDDTINFLFQACITDSEAGFRHALLVWRKLMDKNIKPSIYTFNLMVRCIRDCGMGDVEVTKNVIDTICVQQNVVDASNIKQLEQKENALLTHEDNTVQPLDSKETETSVAKLNLNVLNFRPNLLAKTPHLGNIISLSEVKEPEHRLLLVGGCKGFLEEMKKYECKPDIKTFTQLLDCIPSTLATEKELLSLIKKENVNPDIDFYNMLIKKRSMRFDYDGAKEVLHLIKKSQYRPDLITYGVLALGCKNKEESIEFIDTMKQSSYTLNIEILGAMLSQACHKMNFDYVLHIMELCLTENVEPSKKFMEILERFKSRIKIMSKEKTQTPLFIKNKSIFKVRYRKWLTEVQVDESENQHPWQQFRETNDNEIKYKSKDGIRFKPRRKSLFKVKTSTKQRY